MVFDWINFLENNNIPYVTSGPSVTKNHVCVHCCWCGLADPSEHLSISLIGQGFRCWRQPMHSGKNPAKLIQALLGCSWEQAIKLAGQSKTLPTDFLSKMKASLVKKEEVERPNKLVMPPEFKTFSNQRSCLMYVEYLKNRKFNDHNIFEDAKNYGIYYASQGLYKGRIVFTVYFEGKLCGWTGRTISSQNKFRYETLTNDPEKAKERGEIPASKPISDYLLFYDQILYSLDDTIVLTEGPFDAWRVNLLGARIGVVGTCFFGSAVSKHQIQLLHELLPKFKNKYLLLDQETDSKTERIRSELSSLGVEVRRLPPETKDPGDLTSTEELKKCLQLY